MSQDHSSQDYRGDLSRDELMSALFANLVLQQANMAMMFLGKVPHPENRQTVFDLETARVFIDNLEMLELKTKGNLGKEEEGLLKQSLMNVRMTFVEAASKSPPSPAASGDQPRPDTPPQPAAAPGTAGTAGTAEPTPAAGSAGPDPDEERRKFVKKY